MRDRQDGFKPDSQKDSQHDSETDSPTDPQMHPQADPRAPGDSGGHGGSRLQGSSSGLGASGGHGGPRGHGDFDELCRREHADVLGLAYVLSGSRTAAEELTQDAFFEAFRRWDDIRHYDKPGAWVRRVVANRAVSRRRRLSAELRAVTRIGNRRTAWTEIPDPDDAVWSAVRRLPRRQAQVVALRYLEDLPLDQVAEVLEISEGTAKTHLQRARAALATALEPTRPGTPGSPPDDRSGTGPPDAHPDDRTGLDAAGRRKTGTHSPNSTKPRPGAGS